MKSMGTASSTRAKKKNLRNAPTNRGLTQLNQAEPLDIGSLPQFEMQQSQSISTYQALPPLVLSMQQISRRDKVQKQELKVKVLDENPTLTGLLEEVKSLMGKIHGNIEAKTMSYSSVEYFRRFAVLYGTDIPKEHKKLIGDEIAANGGGQLIHKFLKVLSPAQEDDTKKSPDNLPISYASYKVKCKLLILFVCFKSSEVSQEFCTDLGRSGVFQTLVAYINDNADKQKFSELTNLSVSILRNCVKVSDCKVFMKEAKVLRAMTPYMKSKDPEVSMVATLIVAHVVDEDDKNIVDKSMIDILCKYLEGAMKTPSHQYEGFEAEELVSALMNLASDDKLKETIVNQGIVPFLVELLKKGNGKEKTIAAKTVWVLSFSETNQKTLLENKDLVKSLKVLSKMEGSWRQAATGAIWVLEEEKRINAKRQQTETSPQNLLKASKFRASERSNFLKKPRQKIIAHEEEERCGEPASSEQHIMISYQWSCQKLMIKVKEQLEKTGYRVWIDIESMGGSTLQAMAEAVENAAVVLLCMSRKYKDSPNCRTEAEYAYKLGKSLVPIRVEQNYEPDGWLGALQGSKLYYDLSNIFDFDEVFAKLTRELGVRAKSTSGIADMVKDKTSSSPSNASAVANPSKGLRVKDWTSADVKDWAAKNKLTIKNITNIDGETLLFLKGLRTEAPEYYYRYLSDRLGVTELRGLNHLNKALANLKG